MKIGVDIHGVIDRHPAFFEMFTARWIGCFHEVHIITGQEWKKSKKTVENNGVSYTHYFSIVDYHRKIKDTKMWRDEKGTWWMDNKIWIRSKGDYIRRNKIDVHFDDSYEYAEFIPPTCTFILVPKKNFDKFLRAAFSALIKR